ncbi:hypothetical protein OAG51_01225 [Pirellulaceae bacterium]|nr:hypothetical protein [Pirellulaceae bacterium]
MGSPEPGISTGPFLGIRFKSADAYADLISVPERPVLRIIPVQRPTAGEPFVIIVFKVVSDFRASDACFGKAGLRALARVGD